jgi:hypothetical protein
MTRLKKMAGEDMKYSVSAGGCISEFQGSKGTNSPEEAIRMWCQEQNNNPTEVSINAKSADSVELLNWAKANKDKVKEIMESTGAGEVYKIDYLIDQSLNRASGVSESSDKYGGDQVFPFCQG